MKTIVHYGIVVAGLFSMACGYPGGTPKTDYVCGTMFPTGHGFDAQNSTPPFSIKLSQNLYTPWEELRISVSAGPDHVIKGLFIQARRADCSHPRQKQPIGTFQLLPAERYLQTMSCLDRINSSLTHRKNPGLLSAVFKWFAPAVSVGHIYFVATVVERKEVFWTNVYSEVLRDLSTMAGASICPAQRLLDPSPLEISTPVDPSTTDRNSSPLTVTSPFNCLVLFCICIATFLLLITT